MIFNVARFRIRFHLKDQPIDPKIGIQKCAIVEAMLQT